MRKRIFQPALQETGEQAHPRIRRRPLRQATRAVKSTCNSSSNSRTCSGSSMRPAMRTLAPISERSNIWQSERNLFLSVASLPERNRVLLRGNLRLSGSFPGMTLWHGNLYCQYYWRLCQKIFNDEFNFLPFSSCRPERILLQKIRSTDLSYLNRTFNGSTFSACTLRGQPALFAGTANPDRTTSARGMWA